MQWFKFYGQDFLTDPKMRGLTIYERGCWIVLMCLANAEDKDGVVSFIEEESVMHQAGVEFGSPMWESTLGFLKKFQKLDMVTLQKKTVTISNWNKRQERAMTVAERVRRHRDKQKNVTNVTKGNVNANDRVEKNRIDKTVAKATKPMKKNKLGSYREDSFSDSHDESIDIETGEQVKEKAAPKVMTAYKELIAWAEERRHRKFMPGTLTKQFKAFKNAKDYGLMPGDLKKRWIDFEGDKFWVEKGWDWMSVVYSFNKKPK